MLPDTLPARLALLNACLNGSAVVCLVLGLYMIKRGRKEAHKRFMLGTIALSAAFLVSYLTRYALSGDTRYAGPSELAWVYYSILITHVPLAILTVPLVLTTATHALKGRLDKHKRIARITYPIWLYVSITGVLVYLMLYRLPPG